MEHMYRQNTSSLDKEGDDRLFWIWLSRRMGAGYPHYPALLEKFGSPYELYQVEEEEIAALLPELPAAQRRALCNKDLTEAYDIRAYCKRNGYGILCYGDAEYPLSYRSLSDPPLLLYYRGTLPDIQNKLCIAIVGTRKMSEYGRRVAYKIAYELAAAGVIIVSGMALGIDSVAACAALAAGGQTVALLGCGIDVAYPGEHAGFKKILEQRGLVMSEFAPGCEPKGTNFPIRNRLISGLCQGTLVVEGAIKSGALITADRALSQGRDLFAIPANVGDPNAAGVNQLIRNGAHVVLCAEDILSQYSMLYRHSIEALSKVSLGKRSDYNGDMLARMGVYSRTVDGYARVSAATLMPSEPMASPPPQKEKIPSKPKNPVSRKTEQPQLQKQLSQADHSAEVLQSLNERERRVFEAISLEEPMAIDHMQSLGYSTGELLVALSLLEIKGLIQALPGGLYCRA